MAPVGVEFKFRARCANHSTTSNQKFVCCVFTLTVAIACSTFELWRQTSSARTAGIGHGQVILHRLVCTLRDS